MSELFGNDQNKEALSPFGKRVIREVYLLWVRRLVFRRILPLLLILVVAATFLAHLVFWAHVIENASAAEKGGDFMNYLLSAFMHTGRKVEVLLIGGPIVALVFLRQLLRIGKRLLRL